MLVFLNDMGYIPKIPAQHATDIQMLEDLPQICPVYFNPFTNCRKGNECVHVDGACKWFKHQS